VNFGGKAIVNKNVLCRVAEVDYSIFSTK